MTLTHRHGRPKTLSVSRALSQNVKNGRDWLVVPFQFTCNASAFHVHSKVSAFNPRAAELRPIFPNFLRSSFDGGWMISNVQLNNRPPVPTGSSFRFSIRSSNTMSRVPSFWAMWHAVWLDAFTARDSCYAVNLLMRCRKCRVMQHVTFL
jgi:hypothetical protein